MHNAVQFGIGGSLGNRFPERRHIGVSDGSVDGCDDIFKFAVGNQDAALDRNTEVRHGI